MVFVDNEMLKLLYSFNLLFEIKYLQIVYCLNYLKIYYYHLNSIMFYNKNLDFKIVIHLIKLEIEIELLFLYLLKILDLCCLVWCLYKNIHLTFLNLLCLFKS